jgi:hypothetical protein
MLRLQASIGNAAVTRLIARSRVGGFFDPAAELDESEPEGGGDDFEDELAGWTFNDVTTQGFRDAHVVRGPQDLVGAGQRVAQQRAKPTSTSVLFTAADQMSLVDVIRAKARFFAGRKAPNSLQQQTTKRKFLFVEFRKSGARYKLVQAGFGRIRYAAQAMNTLGGTAFEVNHLEGMEDVERS